MPTSLDGMQVDTVVESAELTVDSKIRAAGFESCLQCSVLTAVIERVAESRSEIHEIEGRTTAESYPELPNGRLLVGVRRV